MTTIAVLLADGFEEIEAVTIIDVLRRAELTVHTLGVNGLDVQGAHGISFKADARLDETTDFDALVLPGGMPGAETLRDDIRVLAMVRRHVQEQRTVAAICAAPMALGAAGVLQGRRATCYPGFEEHLAGAERCTDKVVIDGPVITSRGPGTAMDFALELVARLASPEKAQELRAGMLVS